MRLRNLTLALAILAPGAPAGALTTLTFSGTVGSAVTQPGSYYDGVALDDVITFSITFDETVADTNPSANIGEYRSVVMEAGFTASIGDRPVASVPGAVTITAIVSRGSSGITDLVLRAEALTADPAQGAAGSLLNVWSTTVRMFRPYPDTQLAPVLADFGILVGLPGFRFDYSAGDELGCGPNGCDRLVNERIRGWVALVPEPATGALVALGLAGLAVARRREGTA